MILHALGLVAFQLWTYNEVGDLTDVTGLSREGMNSIRPELPVRANDLPLSFTLRWMFT